MAPGQPAIDDVDSSDDESDTGSDYSVTQTQLAVTDGDLEGDDGANPLVSRIGGRVAWLPVNNLPPIKVAQCDHCSQEMELLVQIFAPLDDSPFDRIVLVWGCARAPCQKKGKGCIRAIRLLAHNKRWAAKLEKKRQKQEAREARKAELAKQVQERQEEEEKRKKINPFSSASAGQNAIGQGLGDSLFGSGNPFASGPNANPFAVSTTEKGKSEEKMKAEEEEKKAASSDDDEDDEGEEQEDDMAEELAIKASINSVKSDWAEKDWSRTAPAYEPAQYLTTFPEPSSTARMESEQKQNKAEMQKLKQNGGIQQQEIRGWEAERYESMMSGETDGVFEKFVKRVSAHGKQVVRYEFGGNPIPFHAKGKAYDLLWPSSSAKTASEGGGKTIVSGGAFAAATNGSSGGREFTTSNVPNCSRCGSRRTFEMQLMPNLVNILRPKMLKGGTDGDNAVAPVADVQTKKKDSEAERRREIEEALGHKLPSLPDSDGITRDKVEVNNDQTSLKRTGLTWNTAFIFVCEKDCHSTESNQQSSWSEEIVEMQFEHEK